MSTGTLQVLPSGLTVPPLPYLVGLGLLTALTVGVLLLRQPAVTRDTVLAFAPWMVVGASFHALYQIEAAPSLLRPLLSAPAVYLSTFALASGCWAAIASLEPLETPRALAVIGGCIATLGSGAVLWTGLTRTTLTPVLPFSGLVIAVVLTAVLYGLLDRFDAKTTARTGSLGILVLFGHALDGISTAIGVDFLGAGERSPIPRTIMDLAGSLPSASVIGSGWLFVVVKVAIAVGILVVFADFVEDEPLQGNVTLGLIAAVGLGPGAHNLLLFAAGSGV